MKGRGLLEGVTAKRERGIEFSKLIFLIGISRKCTFLFDVCDVFTRNCAFYNCKLTANVQFTSSSSIYRQKKMKLTSAGAVRLLMKDTR